MKIKSVSLIIIFFISVNIFSQSNLNNYKYIIVPEQYPFFKEPNQYRLNELTKFLFNKNGFTAFLNNEYYPDDLAKNNCLALRAELEKESSLFKTKLKVILKDCKGLIVFESIFGSTREKNFDKAYNFALRDAFKSFENINYKYAPTDKEETLVAIENQETKTSDQEVKRLQDQVKILQAEKEKQLKELEEAKIAAERQKNEEAKKAEEAIRKARESEKEIIREKEAIESVKNNGVEISSSEIILYAQSIENGYQLVDNAPKIVMILIETGRKDTFIVKDQNAIIYREDGFWYISRIENDKSITKKINIKF